MCVWSMVWSLIYWVFLNYVNKEINVFSIMKNVLLKILIYEYMSHYIKRYDNTYALWTNDVVVENVKCLKALTNDPKLWHKKLGHINMHTIHKQFIIQLVLLALK